MAKARSQIDWSGIGFPSTHLIHSVASRNLSAVIIASEIVDNSFGKAAGNAKGVIIDMQQDRAVFLDDGDGMLDIWKLFELGGHLHDPIKTFDDIGHYGQGAKDALLSLGWKIRVQTVGRHDLIYHSHTVDWEPIANAGDPLAWPMRYQSSGRPASFAPKEIRKGGTIITVTKLHKGRRLPTIEALANGLVRKFRPALRQGREILINVGDRRAELTSAETVKMDDRIEASGEVHGMPFTVIAGALMEHSPLYNKVFYGFGHRVLKEATKLKDETIPVLFTCEIQLSGAWKPYLQTNKLGLASYEQELEEAVFKLVKPVWDTTKSLHDEVRLDHINALLARTTATILQFKKGGETHDPGKDIAVNPRGEGGGGGGGDGPNRDRGVKPGNQGGTTPRRPRVPGIKYRKLDNMDAHYATSVVADDSGLEVRLNGQIDAIRIAYERPFKLAALWPVISTGLTEYLITNPGDLEQLFLDYSEILGVNIDNPPELRQRLFAYFLTKQPNEQIAKAFEPKAAEIGA